jgi:hypothetical protein
MVLQAKILAYVRHAVITGLSALDAHRESRVPERGGQRA